VTIFSSLILQIAGEITTDADCLWTEKTDDGTMEHINGSCQIRRTIDSVGLHEFHAAVYSRSGQLLSDGCDLFILGVLPDGLLVDLDWSATGSRPDLDLDLHLLRVPGDWFCAPWDAYELRPAPDWGQPNAMEDDPLVYADFGIPQREMISLRRPESGRTYRVGVYSRYGPRSWEPVAQLAIYYGGQLVVSSTMPLPIADHFFWIASECTLEGESLACRELPGPGEVRQPECEAE